jgi:predicted peptidase
MKYLSQLMLLGSLVAGGSQARAGSESGMLTRSITIGGEVYHYQIYVPSAARDIKHPPVILFLHGIGQRGEGGFVPVKGPAAAIASGYLDRIPAVILLPQCRAGHYWHDSAMDEMVTKEVEATVTEFSADENRIYLTGVSMGGFGAWHLASHHPWQYAAIVSICGGSPLTSGDRFTPIARSVGSTPVWLFHGADDRIVPVTESRQMVAALKAVPGSNVRYSEFPGVGHNVWMNALGEKSLLPWLLEQRLKKQRTS